MSSSTAVQPIDHTSEAAVASSSRITSGAIQYLHGLSTLAAFLVFLNSRAAYVQRMIVIFPNRRPLRPSLFSSLQMRDSKIRQLHHSAVCDQQIVRLEVSKNISHSRRRKKVLTHLDLATTHFSSAIKLKLNTQHSHRDEQHCCYANMRDHPKLASGTLQQAFLTNFRTCSPH